MPDMKTKFPIVFVSLLALAGCSKKESTTYLPSPTATPSVAPSVAATSTPIMSPSPTPLADVTTQLRDLENRMDAVFADTFRGMGTWFDQSTRANSVDLREQNDKYVARLYIPKKAITRKSTRRWRTAFCT